MTAFARVFEIRTVSRWVTLGLVTGVLSGLAAVAFFVAVDWVRYVVLGQWVHLHPLEPRGEHSLFGFPEGPVRSWALVLAPGLGGLVSGLLIWRFGKETEEHGTPAFIEVFHSRGRRFRRRDPFLRAIASVLVIGSGGSAGREGPLAQMGSGIALVLGSALKLSEREGRLLMLAGAAGGIGAIFRTPLGAALFVVEVLYRDDMEVDGLVPAVLSSVAAYSVFTMLLGGGAIFETAPHYPFHPLQLPLYLVMAVGASVVGVLFIQSYHGIRTHVFGRMPIPVPARALVGGLGVGLLALVVPQALGTGYGWLQEVFLPAHRLLPVGWLGAATLLGIALAKVLATCLTVGSGATGGKFGPSAVIGGLTGGAFGLAFHELFPTLAVHPGAFAIVGMACFVGGVAHAPISTLVMASEMTEGYDLLVPLMLAEAVTMVMMRRFVLFREQVPTRRDSPVHGGEYVLDLLQNIKVREIFEREPHLLMVDASTPLAQLLRQASASEQGVFPVTQEGRIRGVVTLETIRAFFYDESIGALAIAADCATPAVTVTPDDTLASALQRFASSHYPQLPVVDSYDRNLVLGLLSYDQLLDAYSEELMRRRLDDQASEPQSISEPETVVQR